MATVIDTFITEFIFKGDRRELDKFERGIRNLQQRLDSLARGFAISGAAGVAGLGLIGKAGLDTEEALLRTRAALSLTEDQMKTLREEALRVGSTLPLNTADIVDAQRAYGKLGATFEEIIRDTPAIAGAAVATGIQPEQVAQYARIIQNVFGGDPQENMDVMLRIANRSPASFAALGESLQFAGQSASDAGLNFETYVATLAGTAGAGRSVEAVSQGLTAMWARLAKSATGIGRGGNIVREAFEGVGISMSDVNAAMDGTTDGFVRLLEMINAAGVSETQLTALLSTLAGDTYSASLSFAVQNPNVIRQLLDEAALAPGEIERQREIIISGASGGIKEMMAQIDTLLNRLAEFGTLAGIQSFTNAVSSLIGWLTKTNEENELVNKGFLQLISIGVGALASMLAVAAALKITTFALSAFVGLAKVARGAVWLWQNALLSTRIQLGFLTLQTWLANAASSTFVTTLRTRGIAGLITYAGTIWSAMIPALAAFAAGVWATTVALLANPITWVVVGIAALIAALAAAVIYWDEIKAAAVEAWNWIVERGRIAWEFYSSLWKSFYESAKNAFASIWAAVMSFWDRYKNIITLAALLFAPWLGAIILIARNWDRLKQVAVAAWEGIVSVAQTAWGWITSISSAALGVIVGLWNSAMGLLMPVVDPILSAVIDLWKLLGSGVDLVIGSIAEKWDWLTGWILSGWEGLKSVFGWIFDFFGGVVKKVEELDAAIGAGFEQAGLIAGDDSEGRPVRRSRNRANAPEVPELDSGGIVSRPTLAALAMNSRPEVVAPLNPLTGWFERIIQSVEAGFRQMRASMSPIEASTLAGNMLALMNPAAPLPLPIAPAGALAGGSYTTTNYSAAPIDNRTINNHIAEGAIVIHAAAGQNEKEIGQVAMEQLLDQIQSVPAAFDSKVKR